MNARRKFLLLIHSGTIFCLLASAARLPGQTLPGPVAAPAGGADSAATRAAAFAQAHAQAMAGARTLVANGDVAGAEAALSAVNRNAPTTTAGRIELAANLVELAFLVRGDGHPDASSQLAGLASDQLTQGVKSASADEQDLVGNAWEMAGFISVRFRGDLKSAEADYRQALQASPGLQSAQEALNRLLASELSAQQKLQAWSGQ